MSDLRVLAGHIVETLADRLSDPDVVQRAADEEAASFGLNEETYQDLSLATGYPGVALLYTELGRTDPWRRHTGHLMLARATTCPHPPSGGSLYIGLPALAFAARTGAIGEGDYASLLEPLDHYISQLAEKRARTWRERFAERGHVCGSMALYDVIAGLAGLGRYLLLASPSGSDALREVLRYLVTISGSGMVAGHEVPGWWVSGGPRHDIPVDAPYHDGHANVGISHGISGPLALLALAWRAGVRVPGHQEAMERIVDWLLGWRRPDGYGLRWPGTVTLDDHLGRTDVSPDCVASWCYGIPGVARAVQLAGLALNRPAWRDVALDAMRSLLDRPEHLWRLNSASVCHGWAGLLQIASRIATDAGGDSVAGEVAEFAAERTIALFDPTLPLGYRYPMPAPRPPANGVGLLDGAAGTALALHGYATGSVREGRWDAALLLA
ncbi:lanthionine synthetase C family protein [Nonomuraea glycinis]|uniref:lanthionine synthetase C family protein n=1 Tax=Nonomuraea glycinis TaxID=2047744 RepID=UPI0033BDDA6F